MSSKPPKTFQEQLQILRDRGLEISDPQAAEHCLAHHNYYRLSAYRFPLAIPSDPDRFRWADPLPFTYESTGIETNFRDQHDPDSLAAVTPDAGRKTLQVA